ncbi:MULTISPECIES: phosphohydrolase [unclassified Tatumella]|uniref:phosphohydrolase n=1 Tax=unclassified Tatumella TaxID=2649542 RepID=UPI001BB0C664|nr:MULTISPECIES: phosphohydrolase [unclassified Tatumella]MBS0856689.1 phosphohydrolase [Tatumella sp. JGM16]MBS0912903.1 phosphohydrolase [Tatumella sp. JGM91]
MKSVAEWQSLFDQWFSANWDHQDKAHDLAHLQRVWASARKIMAGTEASPLIVLTACYFHDIVNLPKNHPERHLASRYAARETLRVLQADFADFPGELYPAVSHAVEAHSFSAGIPAQSQEAKIVQDADRLESLGAIGLARVFYTSGALGRALFDSDDPFARQRPLNDVQWSLDHFQTKLLGLPATMHTETGRVLAEYHASFLVEYMARLSSELSGGQPQPDQNIQQEFMAKIIPGVTPG